MADYINDATRFGYNPMSGMYDMGPALPENFNPVSSSGGNWLTDAFSGGNLGNTLSGIAAIGSGIMSGITGFQSLGMANKNLSLAKKQFNFQKGLANRNLANQAKIINNTYDSAASVNAAQAGKFGMVDQAVVDKYAQVAKEKHVDGSAI